MQRYPQAVTRDELYVPCGHGLKMNIVHDFTNSAWSNSSEVTLTYVISMNRVLGFLVKLRKLTDTELIGTM